jgi:HK97 family phage prohead protease
MPIKDIQVRFKAGPEDGLADGEFEGYASVFGNVDAYGDVVMPGAFRKTLGDWHTSGNVLPILYSHVMTDPDYNLGGVVEAREDEKGLRIRGLLDLENPKAAQVHRMLKGRRASQMSFAYDVVRGSMGQLDGQDVYELHEVKLYEVSIVLIGANQDTEILAVKSLADGLAGGLKEGRVLSGKHVDTLRGARDAIDGVLAAAEVIKDQEKASGKGEVKIEGADRVKIEGDAANPSARTLAWRKAQAAAAVEMETATAS